MTLRRGKASLEQETAAAIFDRINRRREEVVPPVARRADPKPAVAQVVKEPTHPSHVGDVVIETSDRMAFPATGDRFPRSATMRLVLKHPALALGLGLPAVGLLLKSPASRRLLEMALRAKAGGEFASLVRPSDVAESPAGKEQPATSRSRPAK